MPHLWKTISANLAQALSASLTHLTPSQIENIACINFQRTPRRKAAALELFVKATHDLMQSSVNDFRLNGEAWLIERTGGLGFATIFDVGANVGDWARHAQRHHLSATIHCFEILPSTFRLLEANLARAGGRFVLNPFGLFDENGETTVFHGDDRYISSTYDFPSDERKGSALCKVRLGDDYVQEKEISSIDFLKIDVEGAESKVIKGFMRKFDERSIRVAQFEYNRGAIMSHFLLIDFYEFFKVRGYIVGKLLPQGVLFRDYQYAHEDFSGPNYVACRTEDRALIDAIAARE